MEYQIPQFIEVEDKMFGPFTFKQFLYIVGGGGLCLLLFTKLPLVFAIILAIPVISFSAALTFYRVNNKSFLEMIEAAVKHYLSSRFYLWRHEDKKMPTPAEQAREAQPIVTTDVPVRTLTRSKLQDLAHQLDMEGNS